MKQDQSEQEMNGLDDYPGLLRILFPAIRPLLEKILKREKPLPPILPLIGSSFLAYFLSEKILVPLFRSSVEVVGKKSIELVIVYMVLSVTCFLICNGYYWASISKEWLQNNLFADFVYRSSPNYNGRKALIVSLWLCSTAFISGSFIIWALLSH